MNRTYALVFIVAATLLAAAAIYFGYPFYGFFSAGAACAAVVVTTAYATYVSRVEEKILKTGLVQQYLISRFTADQSTIDYLKKLLREDYNLKVTSEQLVSAIEKEQTRKELEMEKEELTDFKNKYYIGEKAPETLDDHIRQFVTVFGRGSVRNVYYLKKVLEEKNINCAEKGEFTDKIIALKNLIEAEIERRGGSAKKEEQVTINVCPICGNEYPQVLLFCPFCEKETTKVAEPLLKVVCCPQCGKPMVRSILKKEGRFLKGYQCRNLKCLYEMTYEEPHNT